MRRGQRPAEQETTRLLSSKRRPTGGSSAPAPPGSTAAATATSRSPTTAASGSRPRTTSRPTPARPAPDAVCVRAPPAANASTTTSNAGRWKYRGRTARGLAPSTREAYAWTMGVYVVPYFRGTRIGDIGRADVKRFVDHLAALEPRQRQQNATRLAASTIRKIITPLKAMLAKAYELEIIPADAARVRIVVGRDRAPGRAPQTMTREQIAMLMTHLDPRDRLLVLLRRLDRPANGRGARAALGGPHRQPRRAGAPRRPAARMPPRDATVLPLSPDPAGVFVWLTIRSSPRAEVPHHDSHNLSHNLRRRLRPAARAAGVPLDDPARPVALARHRAARSRL